MVIYMTITAQKDCSQIPNNISYMSHLLR